jgi:hypothetical protein
MSTLITNTLISDLESLINKKKYKEAQLFSKALAIVYQTPIFFEYYAYTVLYIKNRSEGIKWLTSMSENEEFYHIKKEILTFRNNLVIKKKAKTIKKKKEELKPIVIKPELNIYNINEQIQKQIDNMEKLPYKTSEVTTFRIKRSDSLYVNNRRTNVDYYAIFDYYPKNRFPEVDEDIQFIRKLVYGFKDGNVNIEPFVNFISTIIINSNIPIENSILIPIPASTRVKTTIRYSKIIEPLAKKLNIKNGYNYITTTDHEPTKGHAGGDKIGNFTFHHTPYTGLNVVLIDDVRTSGTTFLQTAKRILELGANSVKGIFIAKTIGFNK